MSSALDKNPISQNGVLDNRFILRLKRAPNLNFHVHRTTIPVVSSQPVMSSNPFNRIPIPGDHMDWDPLPVSFMVDEDFANYLEIFNWMRGLYYPADAKSYRRLVEANAVVGDGIFSEVVVQILNGQQTATSEFVFHRAFPVSLGNMTFSSEQSSPGRILVDATFVYESFDLIRL